MIGKRIPRYLLLSVTLGTLVAVALLVMFYGQYRWLANDLMATSVAEHDISLKASYERRVRAQLHEIADRLTPTLMTFEREAIAAELDRTLTANATLAGLRFESDSIAAVQAGHVPETVATGSATWHSDHLALTYPVAAENESVGDLIGYFELDQLRAESAAFVARLHDRENESRHISYLWIGTGLLMTLSLCGLVIALFVRGQIRRIRELTVQAEKLRDADFGEMLPHAGQDAVGELAAVFNDMRDKLRMTTISRDYVDSILSGMNEAIIVTTSSGKIKRVNRAVSVMLGFEEDELIGTPIDVIVDKKKSGSLIDQPLSDIPKEVFMESKFGESIPVSYTSSFIEGTDGAAGDRIYAAQNITERRRAEQRIRYLARIDALTKIPNRMQFQHLLQRAIARARRAHNELCLFYVDVDNFKEINDTFGHLAGDTTLETVAERLTAALPDNAVIGRLAGDEFAVVISDLRAVGKDPGDLNALARTVLDRLADPFFVQGHEVFMTASMGIAHYPKDATNVIDLIRNADAALYSAKKKGGNVFAYYKPQMNEAAVERLMTKSRLKRAFERDELLVHYQPKYNIETGKITGAEALVRWELPDRGLILPSDFIPIAEETNLIIEIGEWVLDKVCEDFRFWQHSVSSPGRVSVNLSLRQLRQPNFINHISATLRSHEVSPTSLELEITETTLMENPKRTIKLLDQLYGLGLHLAIDDFGTGYSSLSALQQFPISTLKIDKSFVRDVATNPDDATIVGTIIQMGRNLNMDVVAEGVEDEAQLSFLQRLECTYVQGLLFGDPMSADNYLELLLAQAEGSDIHRALFA